MATEFQKLMRDYNLTEEKPKEKKPIRQYIPNLKQFQMKGRSSVSRGIRRALVSPKRKLTFRQYERLQKQRVKQQKQIQELFKRINTTEQAQQLEDAKYYDPRMPRRAGNYALQKELYRRALMERRAKDSAHHNLMNTHKDSMINVNFNYLDTQNTILNSPDVIKERPDSINVLKKRSYNILSPINNLKFFSQGKNESPEENQ